MCTFISFINESMVYWTRTCSILLFQHRTFSVVTFRFTDHIMTTEVVNLCQGTGQLERLCCTSRRQCSWSSGYCCLQIDRSFRTASFWGVNLWTESCTSEPGNATYLQHSLLGEETMPVQMLIYFQICSKSSHAKSTRTKKASGSSKWLEQT